MASRDRVRVLGISELIVRKVTLTLRLLLSGSPATPTPNNNARSS